MSNTAIVLQSETLPVFNDSSFFRSLDAIDNFFGAIDGAVHELQDDQLLDLFSLVNQLGNRAWITRAIILNEIEERTKKLLNKEELSKEEFAKYVARVVDIAKSTAYEDLQILRKVKDTGVQPRLERTFYKLALGAPDFDKAIEHAEEEYDSLGGKYTTKQFAYWIAQQKGEMEKSPADITISFPTNLEELNILIDCMKFYLKNDPTPQEGSIDVLYQKLLAMQKRCVETG